jgi:hypothetical protein
MGWFTCGYVSHTDRSGKTWTRRVARNNRTGEVERTYGTQLSYPRSTPTNRSVKSASSNRAAVENAQRDLDRTFRR